MDKNELKYYNSLPEEVEVYRGCKKHNIYGRSWTVNLEKAIWFSTRLKNDLLVSTVVKKDNILFYSNSRSEDEIVLISSDKKHLKIKIINK